MLFELTHQNNQPLTTRKDGDNRVLLGSEKTTQRLIFRTDSSTATIKYVIMSAVLLNVILCKHIQSEDWCKGFFLNTNCGYQSIWSLIITW